MKLGLKGAVQDSQFLERLEHEPDVLELHLVEDDLFGEKRQELERKIDYAQERGIQVVLHHPITYKGRRVNIIDTIPSYKLYYDLSTHILAEIIEKFSIECVIHSNYGNIPFNEDKYKQEFNTWKDEIDKLNHLTKGRFLWENSCGGYFSGKNPTLYEDIVKPLGLNTCYDVSHAFISFYGDNKKLYEDMRKMENHARHYHVVDSMGELHDSLTLGEGKIDWKPLKDMIVQKSYIYEIGLRDQENCKEMLDSHEYFKSI